MPELAHPLAHVVGKLAVVVELLRVEVLRRPVAEGIEDHPQRLAVLGAERREGEDQLFADLAEEDTLRERRIEIRVGEVRRVAGVRCDG